MRFTHFGVATALIILTIFHAALDSMHAVHQLPMAGYISMAIFTAVIAALGARANSATAAVAASQAAIDKNSVEIKVEQAARITSVAELANRIDVASAVGDASQAAMHDALTHGTGTFKVHFGPGAAAAFEHIAFKDIFKQAEVTPTSKREASTAAEMNDLASARARLWAELQRPDSESTKLAIPSKAVIIGLDLGKVGGDYSASVKIDRQGQILDHQTIPSKRQSHGGARKRAKERRAAEAA